MITKRQFEFATQELEAGRPVKEVAIAHVLSERTVQRIVEAGTWDRWPYIQAKAKCGYMTPEYKAYLERRGLPLQPPKKTKTIKVSHRETKLEEIKVHAHRELRKRGLLGRLFKRGS